MKIEVVGLPELNSKLTKMPTSYMSAVRLALKRCLLDLKGKSQRLAPVDKGDLRGSAYTADEISGKQVNGEVGFTAPYATRQHEEVGYRHPKGGQAKYLETPFKASIDRYIKVISDAIKGVG